MLSCGVIGHRDFDVNEKKKEELKAFIEKLILMHDVQVFRFSSKSNFVDAVWEIVSQLQASTYPYIKMIAYDCKSEASCLAEEVEEVERIYSTMLKKDMRFKYFDEVVKCEKSYSAGSKAYIIRNQQIIDESDICLFYYNELYKPEKRRYSKREYFLYQPRSGTSVAYEYARQKKKTIYNVSD